METVVIQSIPPKQTSLVTKSSRVQAISLFRPISPSIPIRKVFINRVGTMATPELVRRGSYLETPTGTPPSPLFCTPPSSPESDRSSPWSTTTSNTQSSSTCVESPLKSRVVSTFVQRELNLSQISKMLASCALIPTSFISDLAVEDEKVTELLSAVKTVTSWAADTMSILQSDGASYFMHLSNLRTLL